MSYSIQGSRIADEYRIWQAAEDANATLEKSAPFIFAVAFGSDVAANQNHRLEWRDKTAGGAWNVLSSAGELKLCAVPGLVNNDLVLSAEAGCTGTGEYYSNETAGWYGGREHTSSNAQAIQFPLPSAPRWTELQYGMDGSGAVTGHEYEFRLYCTSNSTVDGVAVTTVKFKNTVRLSGDSSSSSSATAELSYTAVLEGSAGGVSSASGFLDIHTPRSFYEALVKLKEVLDGDADLTAFFMGKYGKRADVRLGLTRRTELTPAQLPVIMITRPRWGLGENQPGMAGRVPHLVMLYILIYQPDRTKALQEMVALEEYIDQAVNRRFEMDGLVSNTDTMKGSENDEGKQQPVYAIVKALEMTVHIDQEAR